jgi:formylglycine-generating enzyme required for sulfatase activity
MTSVTHRRWIPQQFVKFFAVLTLTASLGCQPNAGANPAKKDAAPSNAPTAKSTDATPAPGEVKESPTEAPAGNLPGVEGPVQKMPDPAPSKEEPPTQPTVPVKQVSYQTPAKDEKPAAGNASNPSLEPTVKWLPKPADNPTAEATDQAAMKPYSESLQADVKLDLVPIPGGTFKMGSPASEKDRAADEGPQVNVKIEPFWMGKCEITWAQYELWAMGLDKDRRKTKTDSSNWDKAADAIAIPTKPYSDMTFGMGKEGYPAACMTQFAAKMYCKWLSAKTGHYYRLPTEAEWEYACRAGTTGPYSFGDDPEKLAAYAWNLDNSDEKYHKVGKKKPNPWGLYDMHGNVAEWCLDQYVADHYKTLGDKVVENPFVAVTKGYPQSVRGGSWVDEAPLLRSAARRGSTKDWKTQDPQIPQSIWYFTDASFVGFRVIRPLRVPTPEEAAKYDITDFEKQQFLNYRKVQAGKQ